MRAGLLLALLAAPLRAQEEGPAPEAVVRRITFEEAVDLGLARNLGLRSARLAALMARLSVDVEDAAWDTALTAGTSGGETVSPSRSTLAGAPVVDTDLFGFSLGVEKPIRLGPTLGLEWRSDRTFTNSSFSTINPAWDSALELSLTVPLLRGWGRHATESALRASRASAAGARYELIDEAATLIEAVSAAYWDLVYRQERVRLLEKSVAVALDVEENERRKLRPEIGRSTELDVVTASAEARRREAALISGRAEAANASDELRRLILPFTGGEDDRVVLLAGAQPSDAATIPRLRALVERALTHRPDLKRLETELARLQEGVVQAEDALRFQFDLRGSLLWRGLAGSLGTSIEHTVGLDNASAEASLTFVAPLGRRAARAALRRAQLDLERQRLARDEAINDVIIEVRRAHRSMRTAMEETVATREEVKAARAALEGGRKRRNRGSATVLDVSRLEENLTDAELRLLQARTNLERARVAILRASGAVIERFGVRVGPDLSPAR